MTVTRATIVTAVQRLMIHYKGSFQGEKDGDAVMLEYYRCLERMPWCDDETFLLAVDHVIDHQATGGFLPDWSLIRRQAWRLTRKAQDHSKAEAAISDIRRRSALSTGPNKADDPSTVDAAFQLFFNGAIDGEPEQEGRPTRT